jgi:hypothetical protein
VTRRVMVCQDRDHAWQYVLIAELPSYKGAMKNNELPETQAFSPERMMERADGPPTFHDLDLERVEHG